LEIKKISSNLKTEISHLLVDKRFFHLD